MLGFVLPLSHVWGNSFIYFFAEKSPGPTGVQVIVLSVPAKVSLLSGTAAFFGFILRHKGPHIRSRNEHQVLPGSLCSHAMLLPPFPEACLLQVRKSFPLHQKVCLQLSQSPVLLGGRSAGLQPISSRKGPRQRVHPHLEPPGCYEGRRQKKCGAGSGRGWGPWEPRP